MRRLVSLCICLGAAAPALAQSPALPGLGHPGDGPQACLVTPPAGASCVLYDDPRHHGCGSRGGPGCRKENGRCAAWREHIVPDCRMQARHGATP